MPANRPGVWGIDLGQCALKAIRVELIDGEVTATAFDYIEHPKILSQPDADPDQLTREALDKFLSRNTLKGDIVAISVPGQSGLARFVKLPPVEEKKIAEIVKFEAKQQIPFPLEEVIWDFQRLNSGVVTDGFALETEIGLFAMKRDMVNRALQQFQDVKVEVHVVQMAPLALCNFVTHDLIPKPGEKPAKDEGSEDEEEEEESGKKQCVVALDIGSDNSNLVITDGGKVIWQRPIPIGGNHFTRALTKDLKLTFAKAEHLKRNAVKSPDLKKILAALRPVLNDFVSEVQRSLGYFTNTHRDATVKYMVGLGNAFRLPGLQKFLQEKLQLEVRKLSDFQRLKGEAVTAAPQFTENILGFPVAYGLALQGLELARLNTNLLPQEIRTERLIRAKKPWAAAAAACLLVGIGFLAFGRARQLSAYANPEVDAAIKKADEALQRKSSIEGEFTAAQGEAKKSQDAVLRIAAGVGERFNWNLLYQYINEALPRPADTPNRSRLTVRARDSANAQTDYFHNRTVPRPGEVVGGHSALMALRERRKSSIHETAPTKEDAKLDADIKKKLVQINIEAVTSAYSDDIPTVLKTATKNNKTLSAKEREAIEKGEGGDAIPKAGWIIELRGYTYHEGGERFIRRTLVENLTSMEGDGIKTGIRLRYPADAKEEKALQEREQREKNLEPFIRLPRELKTQVADRIRCVFLYSYTPDEKPDPDVFKKISVSSLPEILGGGPVAGGADGTGRPGPAAGKGPPPGMSSGGDDGGTTKPAAGPTRSAWQPFGEIAAAAWSGGRAGGDGFGTGFPGGPKLPGRGGTGAVPTQMPGDTSGMPSPRSNVIPVPRTEFVVIFVWMEPLPAAEAEAPPTS